ncbi:hypothetical protein RS82_01839 [Microbacterium trichothecenolyticum]|uniref:Uncharacterized protein n=1 Tax=Microbacterium trichothecenolyticum TaxID=69370 RepID=A0A0M2HDT4_MICTR|nr:hypothetical protein RS82_01839 [Microbacterium trichothecenolyticum]
MWTALVPRSGFVVDRTESVFHRESLAVWHASTRSGKRFMKRFYELTCTPCASDVRCPRVPGERFPKPPSPMRIRTVSATGSACARRSRRRRPVLGARCPVPGARRWCPVPGARRLSFLSSGPALVVCRSCRPGPALVVCRSCRPGPALVVCRSCRRFLLWGADSPLGRTSCAPTEETRPKPWPGGPDGGNAPQTLAGCGPNPGRVGPTEETRPKPWPGGPDGGNAPQTLAGWARRRKRAPNPGRAGPAEETRPKPARRSGRNAPQTRKTQRTERAPNPQDATDEARPKPARRNGRNAARTAARAGRAAPTREPSQTGRTS